VDIPLSLPVEQVGALALAIPAVSFVVVQMLKALFYWRAPVRWQERLPDKPVWMGLAFALCVAASVALRLDIPQHLFPGDWPAGIPWWVSAAIGGVLLGVVQVKVLHPLAVKPEVKRKSAAAVVAACAPPADMPLEAPESREIVTEPPIPPVTPVAPEQGYTVRLARIEPLPDDARYLLFTRDDGKAVWMELERGDG